MVRIGVVGVGNMGRYHIANIKDGKVKAVSYTHLDVYKRQAKTSFVISRSTGPGRSSCATLQASSRAAGRLSTFRTKRLYFVMGMVMPCISAS